MRSRSVKAIALLLIFVSLGNLAGCGGGLAELALTAKRLYGVWRLWKLFDDGNPSWLKVASALFQFHKDWTYRLDYVDADDNPVQTETGTWSIDNGVIVLNVDKSTIDPSAEGKTIRLAAHFTNKTGDTLSIARRVSTGRVTISQEQVYKREASLP